MGLAGPLLSVTVPKVSYAKVVVILLLASVVWLTLPEASYCGQLVALPATSRVEIISPNSPVP